MRKLSLNYKWEATTLEGFIQQLAVGYVSRGYVFYVTGFVPERITAAEHDRRLLAKFDIAKSKWSRYRRRKRVGCDGQALANVHYLRHGNFWVMLANHGEHRFFVEHERMIEQSRCIERQYKDIRETPIVYGGYSVSWRNRTSIRMSPRAYRELKTHFVQAATRESRSALEREFRCAPFEPYRGVTKQMFSILRAVNRARKTAGLSLVPSDCVRVRRRAVRPFECSSSVGDELILPMAA